MTQTFQLDVLQNEASCVFCLSWRDNKLYATVQYPQDLIQSYADWRRAYLSFYRSKRGRKEVGNVVSKVDLFGQLEQSKETLLYQFNAWLKDGALMDIRNVIAQAARQPSKKLKQASVDVFVACSQPELARLPWENWTLITQSEKDALPIRLLRTCLNQVHPSKVQNLQQRQKVRILVVVGEDGELNFQQDFEAIQKRLSHLAYLEKVGWDPGEKIVSLRKKIAKAIADPVGWDVLFFAGHSNESVAGGELAIAPATSIQISEIRQELDLAIQFGLKFAFFNSCSGLKVADSLMELGLNQVAIMREPIANDVAQKLLIQFLECLAKHQDVEVALKTTSLYLKTSDERLAYPSAYLVPSLYCQPNTDLFRIEHKGWRQLVRLWKPTRLEVIAVSSLAFLCLLYPVQDFLMERRLLVQAVYRNLTGQVKNDGIPPVLLVAIDNQSLQEGRVGRSVELIYRPYLARLLDRALALNPRVIGIDYYLNRSNDREDCQKKNECEDPVLAKSVKNGVENAHTWIAFLSDLKRATLEERKSIPTIAPPNFTLQGYTNFTRWYVELPSEKADCRQICPFAYLLALTRAADIIPNLSLPKPDLGNTTDLRTQLASHLNQVKVADRATAFITRARLPALTEFSKVLNKTNHYIDQRWLQPILDFSIPPDRVYERITAKKFLASSFYPFNAQEIRQQVVLIAPGGYDEAGIDRSGSDNFPVPMAVAYWRGQHSDYSLQFTQMTGGEAHAYMIHHLLNQRLVVPIPDLWALGLGILLGKGIIILLSSQPRRKLRYSLTIMSLLTGLYGLAVVQIYISAAILLPWCLPSGVLWLYLSPALRRALYE